MVLITQVGRSITCIAVNMYLQFRRSRGVRIKYVYAWPHFGQFYIDRPFYLSAQFLRFMCRGY